MKKKRQFHVTVAVSFLAVAVAATSVYYAARSADAADDALAALRLEQRAWLGHTHVTLRARRGTDGAWEDRELIEGDHGRIRLFVTNTGRTPATNVRFLHRTPVLLADNGEQPLRIPGESEWEGHGREHVVLPGTERRFQDLQFRLNREARYVDGTHVLFVWVRVEYCDIAHRAHWIQSGFIRRHGDARDDFWTVSQSISPPDAAEPDYERCPRPA